MHLVDFFHAALALVAPWITATLALLMMRTTGEPGRWPLALGYGYFLGTAAAAALLWVQGALGYPLRALPITAFFLGLTFVLACRAHASFSGISPTKFDRWLDPRNVLSGCILAVLIVRSGSLVLAMSQNGLIHGWDAASTWMYRARVWVETGKLITFISPVEWLSSPGQSYFSLAASHYPPLVSLIAALPSLAFGRWHEGWSSTPWVSAYVALALALYGQCRVWGTPIHFAMLTVWLVLSLPLLGTQVAVAGYADLWIAASLSLAFFSFLSWIRNQDKLQGALTVLMLAMTASMKIEGVIWILLFIPALIAAWWRFRGLLILTGILGLLISVIFFIGFFNIEIPILGSVSLSKAGFSTDWTGPVEFLRQPDVWFPLFVHLFVFDSTHLLALAVLMVISSQVLPIVLGHDRAVMKAWEWAGLTWVLTACLALYLLFFWTPAGEFVRQGTSVNRLVIQLAPALVFWCHLVVMGHVSSVRTDLRSEQERKTSNER